MNNLKRYTLYILNFVDFLSLALAYVVAYFFRFKVITIFVPELAREDFSFGVYWRFLLIAIVGYVIFNIMFLYNDEMYLKRSSRAEFGASLKFDFYVMAFITIDLYAMKTGESYSRLFVGLYAVFLFLIDSFLRIFVRKVILPRIQKSGAAESLAVVLPYNKINEIRNKLLGSNDWRYMLKGFIIVDRDMKDEMIGDIPVISDRAHMLEDIQQMEIDGVMIVQGEMSDAAAERLAGEIYRLGKKIHVLQKGMDLNGYAYVDEIGECSVITYEMYKPMPKRLAYVRRILSFLTGVVLLPVFLVFYILSFVFTNIESRGPILLPRVRVGINANRFYQYRFRVYRMDAEKRIKSGRTPYTKWGRIIRTLHADGIPQILNLISGDMDIVGPKGPSLPVFIEMSAEERNLLTIRPGIAGYWSCEKDEEKAMRLAQDYIKKWHIGKDITVLLETFGRYICLHSLRRDGQAHVQEELSFIADENEADRPLEYDHSVYTKKMTFSYGVYLFVKRLFDIVLSAVAIVILSPLLLVLTIAVVAGDGGTPFYGHHRIGKNGKEVTIWKFRSMRTDAGNLEKLLTPEQLEQYKREFKIDNDPRITKIGEFIRKTSLDELPQLFNILFGQLSIVGPRPIVREETAIYGKDIAKLLSVKPGLTGYWQAYARNNATYETGERQAMEMYYVDHASLWLDIKIVFKTVDSVVKKKGAQ